MTISSKLVVFIWALPALLFVSIAKTSISTTTNLELIACGLVAMLVLFVLTEWAAMLTTLGSLLTTSVGIVVSKDAT